MMTGFAAESEAWDDAQRADEARLPQRWTGVVHAHYSGGFVAVGDYMVAMDEIARLRAALEDVANPIAAMQRDMPEGYTLDGVAALHALKDPETFMRIARKALDA